MEIKHTHNARSCWFKLCLGFALFGAACATSCGAVDSLEAGNHPVVSAHTVSPSDLTAETVRESALAALQASEGWKVVVEGDDGFREIDWWSTNSSYYRRDASSGGPISSSATDGKVLFMSASDGTVTSQPLGDDSAHPPNPTLFTAYYWYLADGRPLTLKSGGDSQNTLAITLTEAPSGLTAVLDSKTLLPIAFESASEFTGKAATRKVRMMAISLDEIKEVVADVQAGQAAAR